MHSQSQTSALRLPHPHPHPDDAGGGNFAVSSLSATPLLSLLLVSEPGQSTGNFLYNLSPFGRPPGQGSSQCGPLIVHVDNSFRVILHVYRNVFGLLTLTAAKGSLSISMKSRWQKHSLESICRGNVNHKNTNNSPSNIL